MTYNVIDRFNTEDVGNGLGVSHAHTIAPSHAGESVAKWFHIVITADGIPNKFRVFINGAEVGYATAPNPVNGYNWPAVDGMQLSYTAAADQDGMVIGRWMGGGAVTSTTIGLASVVVTKDEIIDSAKALYLYELGKQGIPFDGVWNEIAVEGNVKQKDEMDIEVFPNPFNPRT